MTLDPETIAPTVLIAQARVRSAERLSPAFVRITLESPAFVDLGRDGLDTRFKIVFPGPDGALPPEQATPEEWYAAWISMPDDQRSPMRTYTVRDVLDEGDNRLLVVDFVVHEQGPHGPACRWAAQATAGDPVHVVAPHRASQEYGGIEFDAPPQAAVLLVGDETALPAIARILADIDPQTEGHAFIEVPSGSDILDLVTPPGLAVTWLPRRPGEDHGHAVVGAVRRHLGLAPLSPDTVEPEVRSDLDVEVWETPRYSSAGEDIDQQDGEGADVDGLYAWIAGESWMVKALRRSLVTERQMPRRSVAFMGYWRIGVSMKS